MRAMGAVSRYYFNRLAGRPPTSLANVAHRSFSLGSSGRIAAIRPIIWLKHLPKIRNAAIGMDLKMLLGNIHREYFEFDPVEVHQLRNVALIDGALYSHRYRVQLAWPRESLWHTRPIEPCGEVREAALAATMTGSRWFGHWIWDELPLQALTSVHGQPVGHLRPAYFHELGIRQALGIDEPTRFGTAHLRQLTVATDPPVSPHKTRRLLAMRERLARQPVGHRRIFLIRGGDGEQRSLVNQDELAVKLGRAGFVIFSTTGKSFEEVLLACNGAETLVTVEGSHATPAFLFMRSGGRLVILNPPHRSSTILPDLGLFVGLRGGMFICEPAGESVTDFVADPDEVLHFVDYVESSAAADRGRIEGFVEQLLQHG
jgi:hypothetical protein